VNFSVLMLLFVTLVWGTTFPILKSLSLDLSGVEISAVRFLLAAVCMLPFALRAPRRTWRDGSLLGLVALVSYVTQAWGLQHISSNRSAFITGLNVLMVPFLGLLFGSRISWWVVGTAIVACSGIGLMSWEGGSDLAGDAATLVCAVSYAVYVVLLSQRTQRHDSRQLAATQIILMAVLAAAWIGASAFSAPALATLPARVGKHGWALAYLGVVATAAMLVIQARAQRHVPADKAAVIYAMEPVFAALFAWGLLGEFMGWRGIVGGAMVVLAMIASEIAPPRRLLETARA